ncbi:hypothetical protein DO97_11660 [Neosynechococcus sphagnicola sy1]|uniref:Circadian input-output histidine kinase CikA n=3 Tax=Neosynechococcus TaxID=1501143 RepID=A0A098THZ6_9CYAN|nr:hypothetical protein DO97_11660 [Neosynechococcus sphagnicola sy1]
MSLTAVLYATSFAIVLNRYQQVEEQEMRLNVIRTLEALQNELETLQVTSTDYSAWDDTYDFMETPSQEYLVSNYTYLTIVQLQLNLLLLVSSNGRVVFSKALNMKQQEVSAPQLPVILDHPIQGIILLDHPMLVVATPILTSDNKGPQKGWVVMGRYLDSTAVNKLAKLTQLSLNIYDLKQLPPDLQPIWTHLKNQNRHAPQSNAKESQNAQNAMVIQPLNDQAIAGYTLVNNIEGQPALLLQIQGPRPIYQQAQVSLQFLAVSLLVVGLGLTITVLVLLEKVVLSRLTQLHTFVSSVSADGDLSVRIEIPGQDELAQFGNTMNTMLTTLQQTQEDLQQARIAAEVANHAKSEFLATMSHEIRTPMNAVIGLTAVLLNTATDGQQRELLATIHSSGESLLTIINDILDFSKIESGEMTLEAHPFELSRCVQECLNLFVRQAAEKGLTLTSEIDPLVPTWIMGDRIRLRQILVNLLNNAIKFTPTGEIAITVNARPIQPPPFNNRDETAAEPVPQEPLLEADRKLTGETYELKFAVRDTGIGIPLEQMPRLFKPFSQGDASTTRKYGGTGLGLVICQRLCDLMQGRIWVESQVGNGSTFWFTMVTSAIPDSLMPTQLVRPTDRVRDGKTAMTPNLTPQQTPPAGLPTLCLLTPQDFGRRG